MINAQQILNQKYPNKETTKELDLSNQELDGSLIIQDFPKLEVIRCGNNKDLNDISLINLPKLRCFHANNCQLTNVTVNNCPNINNFNIANNLLTSTNFFDNLNPEKLICLSIHSNNFQEQDLTNFSRFTKLQRMFIDNNDQKKFNLGIYNRFTGSLQSLKDLEDLEYLNIANTDIDSDLEYLPESVKKICLINSWEQKNAGYLKLKWELERSTRFPKVTEKLQQEKINELSFVKNWYRLSPWKQAREIHGEDAFKRHQAQDWLNQTYPAHTNRQYYNEIAISDKNLIGELDLSDFTNLKKLDCSYNQLTNLRLANCSKLVELNCANNEFFDFDFLSAIPNREKIEKLNLHDNQEITNDLNFLAPFTGLRELNIANCSFFGNLKPLENLKNLREIDISNTDLDSGLYYLPDNCWILRCNPRAKQKSIKIANFLTKYFEPSEKYYNLVKWREELRNNIILSIPTERLFVIRGNLKQFINKWNKQEEQELSELIALRSPQELSKLRRYIYGIQFLGRGAAVTGATLTFGDQGAIGGGFLGIYPLTELLVSKLEEKLKNKESKWKDFLNDADNLLDNYNELMGLIEQIGTSIRRLGEVGVELSKLNSKVSNFLENYDKNKDGEININELVEKRKELAEDINKDDKNNGKLWEIIDSIKSLEQEIDRYRKLSYYGIDEEIGGVNSQDQESDVTDDVVNNLGISNEQQHHETIELQQLIVRN